MGEAEGPHKGHNMVVVVVARPWRINDGIFPPARRDALRRCISSIARVPEHNAATAPVIDGSTTTRLRSWVGWCFMLGVCDPSLASEWPPC